jgi:hypothetical protein
LLHAAPGLATGIFQGFDALGGDGVFALSGDQFRAVHLEQRLALGDRLAGDVHVQALHVALELRGDGKAAPLVDLDPTGGAHQLVEDAQFRRLGAHAELLHFLGADLDLSSLLRARRQLPLRRPGCSPSPSGLSWASARCPAGPSGCGSTAAFFPSLHLPAGEAAT